MQNVFVYCEIEDGKVAEVSQELLTKGRDLANQLGVSLEASAFGSDLSEIANQITPYGVDTLYVADDKRLSPYTTQAHSEVLINLFKEIDPQIALMGATAVGRDLGPKVSSALHSGLTADCTDLVIGDHEDKKAKRTYKNLLYQIRPAFGGNIIATIINPDCRPQMATVREGVMKQEIASADYDGKVVNLDMDKYLGDIKLLVEVLERHIEQKDIDIKSAPIVVAGGYGVGSKENFDLLTDLANLLGGEVGASRAAVDSGYAHHDRQIGQTGTTVRPKLYIACGISGQIQHTSGMEESSKIISINTDINAPINKIADYVIEGDIATIIPKMIRYYKENTK